MDKVICQNSFGYLIQRPDGERYYADRKPRSAGSLPTSWTARAQARATAREDGQRAAEHGLSRDVNPHADGTELHKSWNQGWREGVSVIGGYEPERMDDMDPADAVALWESEEDQ